MTPVTATQDEDLLIISEDVADSPADMDFSFSFGDEVPVKTQDETVLTAPVLETAVEAVAETAVEAVAETAASLGDFSLDVFQANTQGTPNLSETLSQPAVALAPENASIGTEAAFSLEAITSPEVSSSTLPEISPEVSIAPITIEETSLPVPATDEGLNDILSGTIAKLALRAEAVKKDSTEKSVQISDIQGKIKNLEEEVVQLEGDISLLQSEADKIEKNIEALEGMKLDPVKEHNARRVVKK